MSDFNLRDYIANNPLLRENKDDFDYMGNISPSSKDAFKRMTPEEKKKHKSLYKIHNELNQKLDSLEDKEDIKKVEKVRFDNMDKIRKVVGDFLKRVGIEDRGRGYENMDQLLKVLKKK